MKGKHFSLFHLETGNVCETNIWKRGVEHQLIFNQRLITAEGPDRSSQVLTGPDRAVRAGKIIIFYNNKTHNNSKVLEGRRSKLTLRLRVAPRRGRRWRPRWAGLGHGRGHPLSAEELHVRTRKVAFLLLAQRKTQKNTAKKNNLSIRVQFKIWSLTNHRLLVKKQFGAVEN